MTQSSKQYIFVTEKQADLLDVIGLEIVLFTKYST